MKSLINETLGGYSLVEELGRGGMAVVYKAYQPKLERSVAVKVLDPVYTSEDSDVLARFRREAKAIAALRHPNILTVYDYGEEQGLAYIVMEYVEGGTLKDRLQGKSFDWERALDLGVGVGRALAFAHDRGIVHRDVKPANILLPREDWPLLADFGLV
ncbi:MAG: serine/threonine-protein kinase, partial [Anaerolineae bacterium]